VKHIFLISFFLFFSLSCFSQDSIRKQNRLTATIAENFYVLKANEQIKNGLYQATYRRHTALASGMYLNNKKNGIWHFYDLNGLLVENFDFSRGTLLYERADDLLSAQQIRYAFDDSITDSIKVTKPIKPGGRYFGYLSYIRIVKLSDDFIGTDLSAFTAVLELLISPGGRLADYKVHIKTDDFERVTTFSTELIDDEDKIFIPATINGKPVISRIFVKCRITANGDLDVF
jgi:hypothetical protein